jgi:hypothetical protein
MTTSKMTLRYRLFPTGTLVPGTVPMTYPLSGGETMTLVAQTLLFEAGAPPPEYAFLFWDVNSTPYFGNQAPPSAPPELGTASFTVPPSAFQATAWYFGPIGGGGSGSPSPIVKLSAFSLDNHMVLPATPPFVSVSPGTVADLTTRTSGFAPAVTITAEPVFSPDGRFKSWFVYSGHGSTASASPNLTVPEGDGCAAIAFYGLTKLSPDPCQGLLDEIHTFPPVRPGDSLPPALWTLFQHLNACQARNGEPVTIPTTV